MQLRARTYTLFDLLRIPFRTAPLPMTYLAASMLARSAVHAAMAGRTNCVVGNMHHGGTYTLVPIPLARVTDDLIPFQPGE